MSGEFFLKKYSLPTDFISLRLRPNAVNFSAVRPAGFFGFLAVEVALIILLRL